MDSMLKKVPNVLASGQSRTVLTLKITKIGNES
jgi:hypothetical protein